MEGLFDKLPKEIKEAFRNICLEDLKKAIPNITTEDLKELAATIKNRTENISAEDINDLFAAAKEKCENNSIQAAILGLQILIMVFPFAMITPLLAVLGFGSTGPVLGSLAAYFQSMYGVNAVFSLLQSAAMGGYGAPIVSNIARGFSFASWVWANSTTTKTTEGE
ncbi:hypothetical protein N7495_005984 [Penicillium taxi]|uniref:uncharacterized protein n=1 Tax=Penicillium taxi TaxID=168475 RepID=UPI002544E1CD|nr:uncharacterized protein N7495_005984 [Penicillium taxi]KAJ5894293.1 hypothetical protein N7495_005984 [Penicillium taxi]